MDRTSTPSTGERRYRAVARLLWVGTALLVIVAGASHWVNVVGRTVSHAETSSSGEEGWHDRGFVIGGGAITYGSTSSLAYQGTPPGEPTFKVRTGVWLTSDRDEKMEVRWMPRIDLESGVRWRLPLWIVALPLLIGAAICQRAANSRRQLLRAGLCPTCGYDLRETPGRCPECGRVP